MNALLEAADRAVRAALVGIVSIMVAVVFAQVVARYGFNRSFGWADEIGRLAFVWSIFLGMAVAVRARGHIAIGLLLDQLPGIARSAARAAIGAANREKAARDYARETMIETWRRILTQAVGRG